MDRGAWRATVHGVTKSQTRLSKLITHTLLWGLHMGGIIQDLSFGNGFISHSPGPSCLGACQNFLPL